MKRKKVSSDSGVGSGDGEVGGGRSKKVKTEKEGKKDAKKHAKRGEDENQGANSAKKSSNGSKGTSKGERGEVDPPPKPPWVLQGYLAHKKLPPTLGSL